MANSRKPGQPKKLLPVEALEFMHEAIQSGAARSEREAAAQASSQYQEAMTGKPFERLRKAYRVFKKEIGSRSLEDFRFESTYRRIVRRDAAKNEYERDRLKEMECLAPEVLGTNDLSRRGLEGFVRHWKLDKGLQKWKKVAEASPGAIAEELMKLHGPRPPEQAVEERRKILEAVTLAQKRSQFASELLALRTKFPDAPT